MITVSENILKEYIKYKKTDNQYDKELMQKFFKYYQPFLVSVNQLINIGYDKKSALNLYKNKRVFDKLSSRILMTLNEEDLIKQSNLKLMIRDDDIKFNNFVTININQDKIESRYSATYKIGENRDDAKKHIKSLLDSQDVELIEICDKYLFPQNDNKRQITINLLKEILPANKRTKFYLGTNQRQENQSAINELKSFNSNFIIEDFEEININIHDRYIKITKKDNSEQEIILSSGFFYLQDDTKDFTYII